MTYYITKYALTTGIITIEDDQLEKKDEKMLMTKGSLSQFYHKGDFFTSRKKAFEKIDLMRNKKLKSLYNQIKKLQDLDISKINITKIKL